MPLSIDTIPCLSDNYAFLLEDKATGSVALVDAPEAAPIQAAIEARGGRLDLILITHHHDDHISGVDALRAAYGAKVWGGAADAHRLPALDRALAEGDTLTIGETEGRVIDVSGHTVGHIAFHLPTAFDDGGAVFSADSLMAMGCGRLFEGTPAQMWTSLEKLAALPGATLVYSGHEYTEANLRFAESLDIPPALAARGEHIRHLRKTGQPTVPSRLSDEMATNPFLRATDPAMQAAVGMAGAPAAEVFAEIRGRKDRF